MHGLLPAQEYGSGLKNLSRSLPIAQHCSGSVSQSVVYLIVPILILLTSILLTPFDFWLFDLSFWCGLARPQVGLAWSAGPRAGFRSLFFLSSRRFQPPIFISPPNNQTTKQRPDRPLPHHRPPRPPSQLSCRIARRNVPIRALTPSAYSYRLFTGEIALFWLANPSGAKRHTLLLPATTACETHHHHHPPT